MDKAIYKMQYKQFLPPEMTQLNSSQSSTETHTKKKYQTLKDIFIEKSPHFKAVV